MGKSDVKKQLKGSFGEGNLKNSVFILSGSLWKIFNIPLFSRDINQVLNVLESKLETKTKRYWVATVNPEFIMATFNEAFAAKKRNDFFEILKKTDINVMDGIGLVWARELDRRLLGKGKKKTFLNKFGMGIKVGTEILQGKHRDQVATGADLMLNLGEIAAKRSLKIFFLGGFNDRAKRTAKFFKSKFLIDNDKLGWCEGEPKITNSEVVEKINKFKPDILLVAYGMKKQEFWIRDNLKDLDVGLVMGVGRSFDYYSGDLKRAPRGWQKMGLEWLYSLIKEPKRFKRQIVLPKFVCKVLLDK